MSSLPQKLNLTDMQTTWATQLDPIIKSPVTNPTILKNVPLVVGSNTINHKLGKALQGWQISRQRGPAAIYDLQDANPYPTLTLTLVSSAVVSVDLVVW